MALKMKTSSSTTNNAPEAKPAERALYANGRLNLIPMPTADPRDPLNLPVWRKGLVIFSLCCFGSMAAAAELILGAMLPVFSFVYAGLDPKLLLRVHLPAGINAFEALSQFPGPPIWQIYFLASIPILTIGVANFFLVPLAIAVGRRNVLLTTGIIAVAGCVGSGFTNSLATHIGCRTVQALGAGTVESLIPFIIQDIVFHHQRNMAISFVFAAQGLILAILGIASPYIIGRSSWRTIYFITAAAGLVFWTGMFFIIPETKFTRSKDEHEGKPATPLRPGQTRPEIDFENYPARHWKKDLLLYQCKADWNEGLAALRDCLRTLFYPHLFFVTMLNSAIISIVVAAGYTTAAQLLAEPWSWPFYHLGLCLIPIIFASGAAFLIAGLGGDFVANCLARKYGQRRPEFQALNLLFPCVVGLLGCILFGVAGDNPERFHWAVFLLGLSLIAFAFLATNTIGIVYVLESHPNLLGPSLVNIASIRCILAFALSFRASEWIAEFGYLKTFSIYGGILGAFILFIPIICIWGKNWRERWSARA